MSYQIIKEKIEKKLAKIEALEVLVADPNLPKDPNKYKRVMQEHSQLITLKENKENYEKSEIALQEAKELTTSDDDEMVKMAEEEIIRLEPLVKKLFFSLQELVIPTDPLDNKNVLVEIRAGTGGDEATLFVADLFRMYTRFSETKTWKSQIISSSPTGVGGYKEIIFSVNGPCYSIFKFESGTHRVQRVPSTESSGRVHTSAITVAVLPEIEEKEFELLPEDIKINTFRSSGPGGQSVNTTDSAIRVVHIPTGTTVSCQDEKSQHKNKAKALRILRARLSALEEEKKHAELSQTRKTQIGSGDRSERIRTYNFSQNRVTDHRVNVTLYQLDRIIEGDMAELISCVRVGMNAGL